MRKRLMRPMALALLIVTTPYLLSCYGRFPLTHAVYEFNGRVGTAIGTTQPSRDIGPHVVFWIFIILPVYGIAMVGDAVIFNLVEFWTGEKLMVADNTETNGVKVALTPSEDGQTLVMTLSRDGRILSRERFVKTGEGAFEVRRADGQLAGRVLRTPDGGIQLTDAQGGQVALLTSADIAGAHSR